ARNGDSIYSMSRARFLLPRRSLCRKFLAPWRWPGLPGRRRKGASAPTRPGGSCRAVGKVRDGKLPLVTAAPRGGKGRIPSMKVRFMGTGTSVGVPMIGCRCSVCLSSDPRNHRTRSSIAICSDRASVIIDTPPEFRLQVLRAGITRLDGILFTHLHADHIFGFDDIRRFNQLQGEPLPVYGAPETIEGIRRVFRYAFEPPQQPGTSMPAVRTYPVEGPFQVGDLRFAPVPILHGRLPVTGYRVGSFAYL